MKEVSVLDSAGHCVLVPLCEAPIKSHPFLLSRVLAGNIFFSMDDVF